MEITKSCKNCEFYMGNNICVEQGYEKELSEIKYDKDCNQCWEISFSSYIELMESQK